MSMTMARARSGLYRRIARNGSLYALLLVPLAYIALFAYYPMYGAQIAFKDYNIVRGIWASPWVGLKHFRSFFGNYMFARVLRNTITISLYSLATFPVPVLLAILIHNMPARAFRKASQMITYAPYFISTVVMCGLILQFLAPRDGLVNVLIAGLGGAPVDFLGRPGLFASVYVLSGVWQGMGYGSIIYISALSGVDPELHEAAIIDGATLLKRIWHIDLPGIAPMIVIMLIMRCGSVLSVGYEKVYLLQNTLNASASEVISTYVYKQGLNAAIPQYSYATAVGLFVSLVNMAMLLLVNRLARLLSGSSLW